MPLKSKLEENGFQKFDFEETPAMSVYLVALSIGKYTSINGRTKGYLKWFFSWFENFENLFV